SAPLAFSGLCPCMGWPHTRNLAGNCRRRSCVSRANLHEESQGHRSDLNRLFLGVRRIILLDGIPKLVHLLEENSIAFVCSAHWPVFATGAEILARDELAHFLETAFVDGDGGHAALFCCCHCTHGACATELWRSSRYTGHCAVIPYFGCVNHRFWLGR